MQLSDVMVIFSVISGVLFMAILVIVIFELVTSGWFSRKK